MSSKLTKPEVVKLVQDSKKKAEELSRLGREFIRRSQEERDLADATLEVLECSLFSADINERVFNAWQSENDLQSKVINIFQSPFTHLYVSTAANTVAYVMTDFTSPQGYDPSQNPEAYKNALRASERLSNAIGKLADKEKVLPVLRQFQLDKASPGKESPLVLFETAWAAYEIQVIDFSPATPSLIPMRECIDETFAHFLRLRPAQENTKRAHGKVISIGTQLFYSSIPLKDIETLANQWDPIGSRGLQDDLSSSKTASIPREEWLRLLRKATLFLREFLQNIDPVKLRK